MDLENIRKHWSGWADSYRTDLRATTKSKTAKLLEVDALGRRMEALLGQSRQPNILEIGCGNGINCIELAKRFPDACFTGVDFVEGMIEAAIDNAGAAGVAARTQFLVGDVTKLSEHAQLASAYDIVFTDRCLINLNSADLQGAAIAALSDKLAPDGHLLMIENSTEAYQKQNDARALLGLPRRSPAEFNRFFEEPEMRAHIQSAGLELAAVEDFSSLHDIVLYALLPSINGGEVDYDHPLVAAATTLSIQLAAAGENSFGAFGQNRLYVCARPAAPSTN